MTLVLAVMLAVGCGSEPPPPYFDPSRIDGGTRDAGTALDGGPPPPPEPPPPTSEIIGPFDPERVYLRGTFERGSCSRDVVLDLDPEGGEHMEVGFECGAAWMTLRANDGHLVYLDGTTGRVHQFVRDVGSAGSYPIDAIENDPIVETPRCERVGTFAVEPDSGELVYRCDCDGCPGGWFRTPRGETYPAPAEAAQFLPGYGGHSLLVLDGGVLGIGRGHVRVGGEASIDGRIVYVRPREDGFRVLASVPAGGLRLFHVDFAARVEDLGGYPQQGESCVVDGLDVAHCIVEDRVFRMRLGMREEEELRNVLDPEGPVFVGRDRWLIAI